MENCGSDGDLGVRSYVICILVGTVMQPVRRERGMSNPDTGNSSNDRLYELSLVGWSAVGRKNG